MSNQLEKLKSSIKKEYTNSFELNLMKTSGFIPVDKRQNDFFVILNKAKTSDKRFSGLNVKFIDSKMKKIQELKQQLTEERKGINYGE